MNDEHLKRAREIFFQYSCNHSYLDFGDDVEEYKKFGVSREQENEWTREYIAYWISQLSVDDLKALDHLSRLHAEDSLPELIRMSRLGDSYARLSFADVIWEIANWRNTSPAMKDRAKDDAVLLWQSLLEAPIVLTDRHIMEISKRLEVWRQTEKNISKPGGVQSIATPEEYILSSAKLGLQRAKKTF